eukprot:5130369-Pleurochrysis_carterae.AAC.1
MSVPPLTRNRRAAGAVGTGLPQRRYGCCPSRRAAMLASATGAAPYPRRSSAWLLSSCPKVRRLTPRIP